MPHLIDARRLTEEFAGAEPHMPLVVFALLRVYFDEGPFEFDAAALVRRFENMHAEVRMNPEQLAALQSELERFFEPTSEGWIPRPGVLSVEREPGAHDSAERVAPH